MFLKCSDVDLYQKFTTRKESELYSNYDDAEEGEQEPSEQEYLEEAFSTFKTNKSNG